MTLEELVKLTVVYETGDATRAASVGYILDLVLISKAFGKCLLEVVH